VTRQRVPLFVGPGPVEVYVDGERLDPVPREIELRADRDHKVFVKREGFQPELVVLEATDAGDRPMLQPPDVRVELRPKRAGSGEVQIEEIGEGPAGR